MYKQPSTISAIELNMPSLCNKLCNCKDIIQVSSYYDKSYLGQGLTWSTNNDQWDLSLHTHSNAEEVLPQRLIGRNPWRQLSSPGEQVQLILHHSSQIKAGKPCIAGDMRSIQAGHFIQELAPQLPVQAEVVSNCSAEQQRAVHQLLFVVRHAVWVVILTLLVMADEEDQKVEDTLQIPLTD